MTILSPEQIDEIERMGVVCVAVESLFETARSAAESEKRHRDLLDAVLSLHHRVETVLGLAYCVHCFDYERGGQARWPCETAQAVARVERGES